MSKTNFRSTVKENKEKSQQRNKYAIPIAHYCKIDPDQLSQIESSFSQRKLNVLLIKKCNNVNGFKMLAESIFKE